MKAGFSRVFGSLSDSREGKFQEKTVDPSPWPRADGFDRRSHGAVALRAPTNNRAAMKGDATEYISWAV